MSSKYDGICRLTENPFLNLYRIDARTKAGKKFQYYFASRNNEEKIKFNTHSMQPEGIAIYAICQEETDKIVLLRQFRYPINDYIYELPAGLIDAGESAGEAAIREMREETGLSLKLYEGGKGYYRNPFFLAQGMSDESCVMVYGTVTGEVTTAQQEDSEEIEVLFANKEEVRKILSKERVSVRAAYLLMQFLHAEPSAPFAFLDI